ncbi:cytochrome c-type biogenesis protein [Coralliovum pocilloporae]|uniref:cytochrome c-type biogenesis protein n=1 Tax=Coralliovum pocilloporae TaxID=3066369 RepID=UPI003306B660
MRSITSAFLALALLIGSALPGFAVNPDEVLDDPALEERARGLSAKLRCLVCQNQSIDDSDADLARDLRVLVRERLVAGDSDDQVISYLVDRYGEFVLLKPRFGSHTLVLWLGGPLVLLAAVGVVALTMRRRHLHAAAGSATGANLSAEDQKRLDALLKDGE